VNAELHGFLSGAFWLKLKEDVQNQRVYNQKDLAHCAYFHVRRLLLTRAGFSCRAGLATASAPIDLCLFLNSRFEALLQFDCLLRPGTPDFFPAELLDEKMTRLRKALAEFESGHNAGAAYLFGVFDSAESWFYPEDPQSAPGVVQEAWQRQSCYWLPVNCREFANHDDWRSRWEKEAGKE